MGTINVGGVEICIRDAGCNIRPDPTLCDRESCIDANSFVYSALFGLYISRGGETIQSNDGYQEHIDFLSDAASYRGYVLIRSKLMTLLSVPFLQAVLESFMCLRRRDMTGPSNR